MTIIREMSSIGDRKELQSGIKAIGAAFNDAELSGELTNRATEYPDKAMRDAGLTSNKYYQSRRNAKRLWNELVDKNGARDYWNNVVNKLHMIGYAASNPESHQLHDTLAVYLGKLSSNKASDLSAFGYDTNTGDVAGAIEAIPDLKDILDGSENLEVIIELTGGYVSWAGKFDGFTEQLVFADAETIDFYSGNLPKRPGHDGSKYPLSELVIDAEDVNKMTYLTGLSKPGYVDELVISNITIDSIYKIHVIPPTGVMDEEELLRVVNVIKNLRGVCADFGVDPQVVSMLNHVTDDELNDRSEDDSDEYDYDKPPGANFIDFDDDW